MSGQPYKYASDVDKFRAEYMLSLGLRADIDDLNLQANKTYKETGALPPVSQMKDTRTTAEILADTEKLKQSIMEDFRPLGSSIFISSIIQKLQTSMLNSSGSLLTFVAQRAPEIVRNLSKNYKLGIKGDVNDVENFVGFIEEMYSKTKNMTESVKTFFNRPATSPGAGLLTGIITVGDVDAIQATFSEIARRLALKLNEVKINKNERGEVLGYRGETGKTFSEQLKADMKAMATYLETTKHFLSTETYKLFTSSFMKTIEQESTGEDVDKLHSAYTAYNSILENLPKAEVLFALTRQLDRSLKNSDMRLTGQILDNLASQFGFLDELPALDNAVEEILKKINSPMYNLPGKRLGGDGKTSRLIPNPAMKELDDKKQAISDVIEGKANFRELQTLNREYFSDQDKINEYQRLLNEFADEYRASNDREEQANILANMRRLDKLIDDTKERIARNDARTDIVGSQRVINPPPGYVEGNGIKKRRGRPRGSGIAKPFKQTIAESTSSAGIYESPRYVHFGKYLVNLHRLNKDGIFAMKRPSGGNIVEIPSMRISNNLSGVIKKMIGGGVPTYKELSTLSEPEKVYLHKVASKANIEDKFSIPTPSKDAEEKDMHQFEVMKGEIMSGNDNKEFIKKFKLLLMKLSKNGSLPKSETSEILHELAELGY